MSSLSTGSSLSSLSAFSSTPSSSSSSSSSPKLSASELWDKYKATALIELSSHEIEHEDKMFNVYVYEVTRDDNADEVADDTATLLQDEQSSNFEGDVTHPDILNLASAAPPDAGSDYCAETW